MSIDTRDVSFSILFPVYNEAKIIEQSVRAVYSYLRRSGFKKFDILVADNGSNDGTKELCTRLSKKYLNLRYTYSRVKGIGSGMKAGIKTSRHDVLILLPIDLALDLKFVGESLKILVSADADVVVGSKGHRNSRINRAISRKIASFAYNTMINTLFHFNIKDTQGAMAFRKSSIMPFFSRLSADSTHFLTQLVIYSKLNNLRIIEIPVIIIDPRKSTYRIRLHAFKLTWQLIREFFIVHFGK